MDCVWTEWYTLGVCGGERDSEAGSLKRVRQEDMPGINWYILYQNLDPHIIFLNIIYMTSTTQLYFVWYNCCDITLKCHVMWWHQGPELLYSSFKAEALITCGNIPCADSHLECKNLKYENIHSIAVQWCNCDQKRLQSIWRWKTYKFQSYSESIVMGSIFQIREN